MALALALCGLPNHIDVLERTCRRTSHSSSSSSTSRRRRRQFIHHHCNSTRTDRTVLLLVRPARNLVGLPDLWLCGLRSVFQQARRASFSRNGTSLLARISHLTNLGLCRWRICAPHRFVGMSRLTTTIASLVATAIVVILATASTTAWIVLDHCSVLFVITRCLWCEFIPTTTTTTISRICSERNHGATYR